MKRINLLLTFSSLSVVLVTIERFSFTTRILLQPYSFMRLHEIVQIAVIILLTVIIPFLIIQDASGNFESLKAKKGRLLLLLFVVGVYFYATGNGLHEVSSFNFNHFCDVKKFSGDLCGGMFFNDFYTGNILYFIGAILMNVAILLFEKLRPNKTYEKKDLPATVINALVYALAIFAYAAFDTVLVGMVYSLIMTGIAVYFFVLARKRYLQYPYTTYTLVTYLVGTIAAILVRFH
ncbi:MAG: hypothetical protein Q7S61_02700 [bacterium]|nr:hypothetical protein [bacterium]